MAFFFFRVEMGLVLEKLDIAPNGAFPPLSPPFILVPGFWMLRGDFSPVFSFSSL